MNYRTDLEIKLIFLSWRKQEQTRSLTCKSSGKHQSSVKDKISNKRKANPDFEWTRGTGWQGHKFYFHSTGENYLDIQDFFYNPNNSAVSKCNCNVTYNTDSLIPFADSFLDSKAAIPNISVQSQQENRRGRHVTQQFKDNINTHQQPKLWIRGWVFKLWPRKMWQMMTGFTNPRMRAK